MSCCNGSKVAAYDTDSTLLDLFVVWMLDNAKVQDMEDRREEEGEAKGWKGCDLMIVYDEGEWIESIKEERSEESEGLGGPPSGPFPLQGVVPWWRTPQTQWLPFRKLNAREYKALFPPCWNDPEHIRVWMHCDQCEQAFGPKQRFCSRMPSSWVCRCGKDLEWRHKGWPHVDATCRTCNEQMVAENVDVGEWCKQQTDEYYGENCAVAATRRNGPRPRRILDSNMVRNEWPV